MVGKHGGNADHRQPSVLQFGQLLLFQVEVWPLRELQRVEAEVTRLPAQLAVPSRTWVETAFHDHSKDRDLDQTELSHRVAVAGIESLDPIRLLWQARDLVRLLHTHTDEGEHAHAAVLDLSLTEPLHVRINHNTVEVKVAVVELGEAQGVPRLRARLDICTSHGPQRLLATRLGNHILEAGSEHELGLIHDGPGDTRALPCHSQCPRCGEADADAPRGGSEARTGCALRSGASRCRNGIRAPQRRNSLGGSGRCDKSSSGHTERGTQGG
mmetsp:Transcript_10344/g.27729  ORF Transcript_10344/g.27729 Transcript_10344/m.27729 type:complete len:270 (-) Transcript_10344:102-911(-)